MSKPCVYPGCDNPRKTRGLCGKHYQQPRTREEYGLQPRVFLWTVEDRLKQYEVNDAGCWIWTAGQRGNGYGDVIGPSGKTAAHRASYEHHVGPIPIGVEVCHRCDVPLCINPEHLFLGTHADNMADMSAKGRSGMKPFPKCRRGHVMDEANTLMPPSGGRQCRKCNRARYERYRLAQGLPISRVKKSHCPHGHEFTDENTYITPEGYRHCRKCQAASTRAYEARKRRD